MSAVATDAQIALMAAAAEELVRLAVRLEDGKTDRIRAILDAEDRAIELAAEAREQGKFPVPKAP